MLELPNGRSLKDLKRLLSTEGVSLTLLRSYRQEHPSGPALFLPSNHRRGERMTPGRLASDGKSISIIDHERLHFVSADWWTYELDDFGNTIKATKHAPGGVRYLEYAIDFPNQLDGTRNSEPDTLEELEGK